MRDTPDGFKETEIGPLPADWDVAKLGDIVYPEDGLKRGPWGGSVRKDMFVSSGYKVYEQKTVIRSDFSLGHYFIDEVKFRELEAFAIREGDILLTAAGTIGKVALVPKGIPPGIINQALIRIRLQDKLILNGFFLHLLEYYVSRRALHNLSHGATLKNLASVRVLKNLAVPLPPLPEQRRIAHVLSTIQQTIAAQDDLIAAACELKRSLMQRLFTYGSGAEPAPTKETEIGEIPQHWGVVQLENVVDVKGGKRLPKGHKFADGPTAYPYIRVVDFQDESVDQSALMYLTPGDNERIKRYTISSKDVYISIAGTTGLVGIVPQELDGANLTENAAKLVIRNRQRLLKHFLVYALASERGQVAIRERTTKTSQPKLALMRIKRLPIPFPPPVEQKRIADILIAADRKVQTEQQRKAVLKALFQSLLHQLMTGQIRLKDAEL